MDPIFTSMRSSIVGSIIRSSSSLNRDVQLNLLSGANFDTHSKIDLNFSSTIGSNIKVSRPDLDLSACTDCRD